jgi:arginyl-tRNA synthetase
MIRRTSHTTMFDKQLQTVSQSISDELQSMDLPMPESIEWNPVPFKGRWGYGTAALFQVAAAEARSGAKVNVPSRANEIAERIASELIPPEGFEQIEVERGYLNLYVDSAFYARTVVDAVLGQGADFGRGSPQADKVMVEFAQPNTHHSFHIGHARNAFLGECLARILEFAGYETVRASYPGDIGLGVIQCLWGYQRFHAGEEPEGVHARGQWLADVYAEAHGLLTRSEDETPEEEAQRKVYEDEVREIYHKWDRGDSDIRALWRRTRQWSLDELSAILDLMGVHIDVYFFESEVDEPAKTIVSTLIQKGIADDERPEGPVLVRIDEQLGLTREQYRTAVILRSDGTTLYLTKDLALAKIKFEAYEVERSIYVVDVRQSLHFQQAFKILELWGFPQAAKCHHLPYGFVSLPEGAMSARKGNVVLFMDVVQESYQRVRDIIAEKNPDLGEDDREQVAHQVGLGALAYSMLSVDNTRDMVFDWGRALDFEGQAAPYIQYAHVRASSILRRASELPQPLSPSHSLEPTEIALLDRLSRFPAEVARAADEYKPLIVANFAYDLARDFTSYYQHCPVLQAPPDARGFRLRLTEAARQTLSNCLTLLVMQAPEVM